MALFLPPSLPPSLPGACAHVEIRETRSLLRLPQWDLNCGEERELSTPSYTIRYCRWGKSRAKTRFLGCASARQQFANLGQGVYGAARQRAAAAELEGHNWFHSAMFYWGTPQIGEIPVGLGGAAAASIGLFRDSRRDPVGVPKYDVH